METGDIITAPVGQVHTLRDIATQGAAAFYGGDVGRKLVQDIQNQGKPVNKLDSLGGDTCT